MKRKRSQSEELVIRDNPDAVLAAMQGKTAPGRRLMLGELFEGEQNASVREAIRKVGYYQRNGKRLYVSTRAVPGQDDREVVAIAAVARDPGRAETFIDSIQDYDDSGKARDQLVDMYWRIYENEGLVNNATNKIAAILSSGGEFKVRRAKKGKARKAVPQLQLILDHWMRMLNQSGEDAVVTGARGLKAVTQQGVRQALVEGSWVGRMLWVNHDVEGVGSFDLPMSVMAVTTGELEPVQALQALGGEAFYWKPPRDVIRELTNPKDKETAKIIKKTVPTEMLSKLKRDGKVLLDPALLLHVKHRGRDRKAFGESFIHSALHAIVYARSIDQLDMVSMQNLINRLTVVMVGTSDPASPYSNKDVAAARAALMQQFFEEPGPNMTIIWQGDDVKVEDVGAHEAVLDLDDRHRIGEGKIKVSLGVPEALLSGTTTDGKAAGWAASIGAAAEMEELQNAFSQVWTQLGMRIATENGFTDIDLVFEFSHELFVDRAEERNQARNDYLAGVLSIRSYLEAIGKDPDAEFRQRAIERGLDPDDESLTWEEVFMPPQGMQGQGEGAPPGQGGGKVPGKGRTPNDQKGKPTSPERKEKPTPVENK